MTAHQFAIDTHVHWAWGRGEGHGRIAERFEHRVERIIKGTCIVRNGSAANPAYLIAMLDGRAVLKLGSELSAD
ncbi:MULTISPECIES: DUF2945 domain-containing protein [unclassified Sphingopyxis]|jgi:hypothetical protein|uniref:DUF2945 domain-containing protein n=1 Tax=unclassified Sphingopyxis TaxID=2614943 RepID=UPI00285612C6|nr:MULTISPECIES: DUF2945 domain-containing protein [unclassified Sphingopyxis]MDR6833757.1 hypothetical protein [Sphingopyxis sp. BE122]MDR7226026.1 hypothetical protein [Sphingopyxis sp. BE259]